MSQSLSLKDKKHLWHPLTQHKLKPNHLAISKAKGVHFWDENGKKYIDGISSWYTCMYGHCHPYIQEKLSKQLGKLDHVIFSGLTHEPAINMAEKLMDILPDNQEKIFFSDNGSTSVEVALKMALQYHFNLGNKRHKIICFENAFHGDTFGAMSVSGLSVYNGPFSDYCIDVERIPIPTEENWEIVHEKFLKLVETNEAVCFVFEPLVQGAAAMKMYEPKYLDALIQKAKEHNTLCIADEVMTGFGKTGKHFASLHLTQHPDILCLSKSLTGGAIPMALTTCTKEIFDAFYDDDISKGLFHGHTYSAHPLACTAVSAGIDLLVSEYIQRNIEVINQSHIDFSKEIENHPKVESTRVMGVIFALDLKENLDRYGKKRDSLYDYFMDKGIFLRPLGNTIYILAPFVINQSELNEIYSAIKSALDELV
jgi:adenosylmethionine-8-amino-7-oxononanoate aminotransferase